MSTTQKDILLSIRDIVVEFRSKGKRNKAVKETSMDIYRGEIFGLVGESGSGKTTIGRAIVGVQDLKDGAVYMDNNVVAGRPTSLYNLNKEIWKKVSSMELRMQNTTKFLNDFIESLKTLYINFENDKDKYNHDLISKEIKKDKVKFVKSILLSNLRHINRIIYNQNRMIKFVDNLNDLIPEVSKKLEKAIIIKQKETKEAVLKIKENADESYLIMEAIQDIIRTFRDKENIDITKFFQSIFIELKNLISEHKQFLEGLKWVKELQQQNLALSAPLRKRDKFIKYYNNLIYISRSEFLKELKNQLSILESNNQSDSKKYNRYQEFLRDFWSKSNISLNSCQKIIDILKNNNINYSKLETIKLKLKETDFENELKSIIKNKKEVDKKYLIKLETELKQIKKVVAKDIMKDQELIDSYYEWKSIEAAYSKEEVESFIELIEFLDLPSIDEIVKDSYLFKSQTKHQKRENRRNIQMIFQDPGASLNDRMAIEEIIAEGMENYKELYSSKEAKEQYVEEHNKEYPDNKITIENIKPSDVKKHIILKLVKAVGLLPEHLSRYPHEFSGGQRQRVGIARSLAMKPKLIVADEPISALDVSIRAQVLNLFKKFQAEMDLTFIFVAHDLSVVRHIADRIAVIYHGEIVELAEAEELFNNPLHPYTKALLSAIPIPEPEIARNTELVVYEPEISHYDYLFDLPSFTEVIPGHFVHANKREIKEIKTNLKSRKE